MSERILVAGVGNLFLGDDAFGCEVVKALSDERFPEGVQVTDYGIGGIHLAFDLLDGWDALVMVDCLPRGGEPGDVFLLEIDPNDIEAGGFDAHSMDPGTVFASLATLGGELPRTLLVGCEPEDTGERLGLSAPAAAAVRPAADMVREVVGAELARLREQTSVLSATTEKEE